MSVQLRGLIAATFTPLHPDGTLWLDRIPALVDHLERDGVAGIYILGSTGEGVSLSTEERQVVAEAYVEAAWGRLKTVVQVGHNSLTEARRLAAHARDIGADAISATPPMYFKPTSIKMLIDCIAEITSGAPDLPFFYYHIPPKTGVTFSMPAFLEAAAERLPTLAGLKFSDPKFHEAQACLTVNDGAFQVLTGVDEMLLSAWAVGIRGVVGSTYNFAAPLYRRIIQCFERGDLEQARQEQARVVAMVDVLLRTGSLSGLKAVMTLIGQDCGPTRLPIPPLDHKALADLEQALKAIGFFDWARH